MIATTMLVVGLFAILSWDSTFPDRRDVMVLGAAADSIAHHFLRQSGGGSHGVKRDGCRSAVVCRIRRPPGAQSSACGRDRPFYCL